MTVLFERQYQLFLLGGRDSAEDVVCFRSLFQFLVRMDIRHVNGFFRTLNACFQRDIAHGMYAVSRDHL